MDFDGIPLTRMSPGLTDRLLLASPAGSLQDTSVTATAVARPDSSIFGPILQYASNYPEGAFTAIVALTALALTTPFTAMVAAAAAGAAMIFTELGIVIAANGNTVIPQWLGEPVPELHGYHLRAGVGPERDPAVGFERIRSVKYWFARSQSGSLFRGLGQ